MQENDSLLDVEELETMKRYESGRKSLSLDFPGCRSKIYDAFNCMEEKQRLKQPEQDLLITNQRYFGTEAFSSEGNCKSENAKMTWCIISTFCPKEAKILQVLPTGIEIIFPGLYGRRLSWK